jgi:hypothetical protein
VLPPRGSVQPSNLQAKVILGIDRHDAEYFAKLVGRVDAEAVKRDPKTETQHELFYSLPEQWGQWVDRLRFQTYGPGLEGPGQPGQRAGGRERPSL